MASNIFRSGDNPMGPSPAPLPVSAGGASINFPLGTITNPTGTQSLTRVMMGLGALVSIIPVLTGRVLIVATGTLQAGNTGPVICQWQLRAGTGTPPINGAALTGSYAGPTGQYAPNGTSTMGFPATLVGFIPGLTLGVPLWIDVAIGNPPGGSSANITVTNIQIQAFEI